MSSPAFLKVRAKDADPSRVQDSINATLEPIAKSLNATPIMGAPPPVWVRPDLLNGFVNLGGGWALASYHRDALGYVHGQGRITHVAGTAAGTTIFTLPTGYRPLLGVVISVRGSGGVAQAAVITPAGLVYNDLVIAAGGDMGLWFTFLAER